MASPSNNQFQPILVGGQPIFDLVGDQSPISTDIVGNTQFPAAFLRMMRQTFILEFVLMEIQETLS
ncbi:hypothetical protein AAAC51_44570 [Priestia megaterium]